MMERRGAKRYKCGGRVEIPRVYSRVPLFGIVVDVSEQGCGICLPTGAEFDETEADGDEVELRFKSSYLAFSAKASVKSCYRHREFGGPVLGVRFTELTARGRADIAEFIRDQEEISAARSGAGRVLAFA